MPGDARLAPHRGRRAVTGVLLGSGVIAFAIGVATGNVGAGASFLAFVVLYALALRLGGRNAAVRLVRGEQDEREVQLFNRANALFVGVVCAGAVIGSIVEQVAGDGPGPFTVFCVGTAAFYAVVVGVLWLRG